MAYPDDPLSPQWSDDEDLDAVLMGARIDDPLNAVGLRVADSGFATTGITAAGSGGSISGVQLRTIGPLVFLQGRITIGTLISVPSDGDLTNTQIGQITDSALWPSVPWEIGSGSGDPQATFQINTAGHVNIVSIDSGATLTVSKTVSFCGDYPL